LNNPKRVAYSMRYITVDSIETLPQENK
jgi:hypothetical protein